MHLPALPLPILQPSVRPSLQQLQGGVPGRIRMEENMNSARNLLERERRKRMRKFKPIQKLQLKEMWLETM